ncbi:MAG: sce7726 family protein [Hyphomonadaceae bacterium]
MNEPWLRGNDALTTDKEIREAFLRKKLSRLRAQHDTLIVEELGLVNATARVDIAVLNGCLHGFEIKSGRDTLDRLPEQLEVYSGSLEKLTIVCAERHLGPVRKMAPDWAGLVQATRGPRGGVYFEVIRRANRNPEASPELIAHLLWRAEAAEVLARFNEAAPVLRRPRAELYRRLGQLMTTGELTAVARQFMLKRQDWRSDLLSMSYAG